MKFAYYYENTKKDYNNAEKYYLMSADKGNLTAINNLIIYYENNIKNDIKLLEHLINYQNMIKREKIIETIKKICNSKINKDS